MRNIVFSTEEYYHIYNRGIDKRSIFECEQDYFRFIDCMWILNDIDPIISFRQYQKNHQHKLSLCQNISSAYARSSKNPLVEFIAYCLNRNHYHLILKQLQEKGIEKYMHKLGTSYTKYFNSKYERSGSLFQGKYKAIHINSNEYLLYLSAYVNRNHIIHGVGDESWKYCSLPDYLGKRSGKLCNKNIVLEQFNNELDSYENFSNNCQDFIKSKKDFEKFLLE